MTNHTPGRKTDALVHRALWPDDKLFQGAYEYKMDEWLIATPIYQPNKLLPAYTTDLAAWKDVWDHVGWVIKMNPTHNCSVSLWTLGDGELTMALADYADHDSKDAAQAFARSRCVLQLAERGRHE